MKSNGRKRLSWEQTALNLAFNIADYRSEDPYVQVGAVIIKNDNSFLLGYNGSLSGKNIDWSNRDERRKVVFHAEENVLADVKTGEIKLLAVTHLPCSNCLRTAARKGVTKIIYSLEAENYDNEGTKKLAKEFSIELKQLSL